MSRPVSPCLICNPTPGDTWADMDPICDAHEGIEATGMINGFVSREEWNSSLPSANAVRAMLREAAEAMLAEQADKARLAAISERFNRSRA